jgi:hypothetical protein
MALQPPVTLKDILEINRERIHYWLVDNPSVLEDLDTPEDYQRFNPSGRS